MEGATIVDQSVTISMAPEYQLPPSVASLTVDTEVSDGAENVVKKAEDVVSSMLARGFTLGKDALTKAKEFDEKHQFTSTATSTVTSMDQKIGFTEKLSVGTTIVNEKVKEMDEKFQVSEKTKNAFAAAEQTVSSASSTIMKNRYILTGASWVTRAFSRVAKTTEEVVQKTKEKMADDEKGSKENEMYSRIHHEAVSTPEVVSSEQLSTKPEPAQGLIL